MPPCDVGIPPRRAGARAVPRNGRRTRDRRTARDGRRTRHRRTTPGPGILPSPNPLPHKGRSPRPGRKARAVGGAPPYNVRMTGGQPEWTIREDAGQAVLVALYVRQVLGIRSPDELPALRRVPAAAISGRSDAAQATLEREWREYWAMTVEPQAHPSLVPLELLDGFETLVALPVDGAGALREAMAAHADDAVDFAREAHGRYFREAAARPGVSYRAYASAIAAHERSVGRRAHSFELNVQVLPLAQRGVWWIGSLTVAVTDGLRADVAAFDTAIHPIIAELA